jgi:hypothetical protein
MSVRSEQATVYRLSATLEATIRHNGILTIQRNERPPLKLTTTETRNLQAALTEQETTDDS